MYSTSVPRVGMYACCIDGCQQSIEDVCNPMSGQGCNT